MRQIFRIARQVAPTVMFFDQLEAIAPIRGSACRLDDHRSRGQPASGRARRCRAALPRHRARRHQPHRPDRSFDPAAGPFRRAHRGRPARRGGAASVSWKSACARRVPRERSPRKRSSKRSCRSPKASPARQLKQLCDDAKRTAIKRTDFTKVAAPTVADMLEAMGRRAPKNNTETTMAEIERTRERERPPLAGQSLRADFALRAASSSSATRTARSWSGAGRARCSWRARASCAISSIRSPS